MVKFLGTSFQRFLRGKFGRETTRATEAIFDRLGLPLPEKREEFYEGTEGALVFVEKYGVVLRIEHNVYRESDPSHRIDDNPWILQPLATLPAARYAVVELVPGCRVRDDREAVNYLWDRLLEKKIIFWDKDERNVVHLPVETQRFPNGIPVVGDRLAVRRREKHEGFRLKRHFTGISAARVKQMTHDAAAAQTMLYEPLRERFADAWSHAQHMPDFWRECIRQVNKGRLVSGWKNVPHREISVPTAQYHARLSAQSSCI